MEFVIIIIGVFVLFAFIAPSSENMYDAHMRVKNPNRSKKGRPARKVKKDK